MSKILIRNDATLCVAAIIRNGKGLSYPTISESHYNIDQYLKKHNSETKEEAIKRIMDGMSIIVDKITERFLEDYYEQKK